MRRILFLLIAVVLVGATPMAAQGLTKADRDMLVQQLKKSQKGLETAAKGLSEAQWSFKPGPDRWSVAECYEHLAASEDFLFERVTANLKTPAQPEKKSAERQKQVDAGLLKGVPDRSQKFQAPEPLKPSNRFTDHKGSQKHFASSRKNTIKFVKSTKEDLRGHFSDGPAGIKDMDAAQWILLISLHSERHTAQINEVKADPNFPKK